MVDNDPVGKKWSFDEENRKKIHTPIILLTAKGEPNERIEGLEIGADYYLRKPFEPKELELRINNMKLLSEIVDSEVRNLLISVDVKDITKSLVDEIESIINAVSYTHLTLPTTPYV